MLCLPFSDSSIPMKGNIFAGFTLHQKAYDPAGFNHDKLVRLLTYLKNPENQDSNKDIQDDLELEQKPIDMEKMNAKRRKKSISVMRGQDFYEVLNIDEDKHNITEEMIKKSYKKLAMLYHPDKHDEGKYDEIAKEQWLKIQEAYETLVDSDKRRKYDCSIEFNDDIPEKFDELKSDFFETFAVVFRRNGYFSKKQPVPVLGTPEETIKKVLQFYEFWGNFDSWREFVHEEEYDVNQAESRGERRWMEQENRRLKASLIKAERARISKLVNFAYQNDPRIKQYLKKQEDEKEQKKLERKLYKEKQKQEELTKQQKMIKEIADKKNQIEEQKKLELEEKQKKVFMKKQADNELRKIAKENINHKKCDDFYIDEVCFKLYEEELVSLTLHIKNKCINKFEELDDKIKEIIKKRSEKYEEKDKTDKTKPEVQKADWTKEELSLLTKGIIKFPSGISERWSRVSQYIGGRFTDNECADKAKLMKTQHAKDLQKKEEVEEVIVKEQKRKTETEKSAPKPTEVMVKDNDPANWTQDQQRALEIAMKKYPGTLPLPVKERWDKIAEEVEGKNTKECVERFKFLKDKLKK